MFSVLLLVASLSKRQQHPLPPMSDSARAAYNRVVAMLPAYNAAKREMIAYDSAERARRTHEWQERLDTAAFGPLRVIAAHRQSAEGFALFRHVYAQREAQFDGVNPTRPVVILLEVGQPVPIFREMNRGQNTHTLWLNDVSTKRMRYEMIDRGIDQAIYDLLPSRLQNWIGDGLIRASRSDDVFRELATSDVKAVRRCYDGSGKDCADALGLVPHDRATWYTPEQLRDLVRRMSYYQMNFALSQCVQKRVYSVCADYLRHYGDIPTPLSTTARGNFLLYTLARGGRGSIARVAASDGTFLESTAAAWSRAVAAQANSARRNIAGVGGVAVFWMLLLLGLSFRSTRRRFGLI